MAVKKNNTIKLKFDSARNLAPAPESKSAAKINERYDLFINGKFEKPSNKKYFATINPATEEKLSEIAEANAAVVAVRGRGPTDNTGPRWIASPCEIKIHQFSVFSRANIVLPGCLCRDTDVASI